MYVERASVAQVEGAEGIEPRIRSGPKLYRKSWTPRSYVSPESGSVMLHALSYCLLLLLAGQQRSWSSSCCSAGVNALKAAREEAKLRLSTASCRRRSVGTGIWRKGASQRALKLSDKGSWGQHTTTADRDVLVLAAPRYSPPSKKPELASPEAEHTKPSWAAQLSRERALKEESMCQSPFPARSFKRRSSKARMQPRETGERWRKPPPMPESRKFTES